MTATISAAMEMAISSGVSAPMASPRGLLRLSTRARKIPASKSRWRVTATVALLWRPLLFASADPEMAAAAGVKVRLLSVIFAILVGLTAAQSVQIVGALLVMALLITPGAAAVAVTNRPGMAVLLSVIFAEVAACGGLVLSLAPGVPVSVFVTSISFGIYLMCRLIGFVNNRRLIRSTAATAHPQPPQPNDDCHSAGHH